METGSSSSLQCTRQLGLRVRMQTKRGPGGCSQKCGENAFVDTSVASTSGWSKGDHSAPWLHQSKHSMSTERKSNSTCAKPHTSCSSQRACRLWKRRNDVTWTPYVGGGKNSTTTLTYTADECYCTTVRLIQWPALMGFHWKLYSTFPYPVKIRNHMFSPW